MNLKIDWIKDIIKKSEGEYEKISCPFLESGLCSIYEIRPSCCRSYPQNDSYCTSLKCKISLNQLDGKNESSNQSCFECKEICCKGILVPKKIKLTKDEILKWLDIGCEDCGKLF